MDYKFSNDGSDLGLINNGFEIRGIWNGREMSLQDFLSRTKRIKDALEWLERQPNLHPDDREVIKNALA
jgi:hypothetical protein